MAVFLDLLRKDISQTMELRGVGNDSVPYSPVNTQLKTQDIQDIKFKRYVSTALMKYNNQLPERQVLFKSM